MADVRIAIAAQSAPCATDAPVRVGAEVPIRS